jgi:hypothetical protein
MTSGMSTPSIAPHAQAYQFKVTLPGISLLIWSRFHVRGDSDITEQHR